MNKRKADEMTDIAKILNIVICAALVIGIIGTIMDLSTKASIADRNDTPKAQKDCLE